GDPDASGYYRRRPLAAQYLAELLDETSQGEWPPSRPESKLTGRFNTCILLQFPGKFSGHYGRHLGVEETNPSCLEEKMEILIFALTASYSAYRQQESVVAELEEFQPFDLRALRNSTENKPSRSSSRREAYVPQTA